MSFKASRSPFTNSPFTGVPTVVTQDPTSVANTTATGNGILINDGGHLITEMGFVWSTSANPTTADNKVSVTVAYGAYTGSITGLSAGTTYHVRAYAISSNGTGYGGDVQFTTTGAGGAVSDTLWPKMQNGFFWSPIN